MFIGLLSGCSAETTTPKKSTNSGDGAEKQVEKFKVGERVEMGELVITVNNIKDSVGGEFLKPAEGNIYKIADCTIENLSDKSESLSSMLMFKMADSEGYNYTITITEDSKTGLDGELGPGRKMRGEVAFEVPSTAAGLELIFEPNFLGFGQAIIELE